MCSMNMLFNWDTKNLCIVFSWWRVDNIGFLSRKYDASIYNSSAAELQDDGFEENATVTSEIQTVVQKRNRVFRITFKQQMIRSLIYTVQVFISFFTMLIFMTYNGFLMFSVAIGAGIGYLFFGKPTLSLNYDLPDRLTCH
ncbi:4932_t:CDS:2 [Funneliformis caledonium]|uniref:Copper transport protein n=1 Tax=Funneliformis caledonium TaxID=1117310 RepID=A0A9N9HLH3_9GLOM|nr:4932_t:CDS:2 [Funneliformis caledonium]